MNTVTNPLNLVIYKNKTRAQQCASFYVQTEPHPLDVVAYSYEKPIALIFRVAKNALVSQIKVSRTTTIHIRQVAEWLQQHGYNVIHRQSIIKTAYERT